MDEQYNTLVLGDIIFIIGCHPYSSTLRIDGKREPLGGDERPVVADLCQLGLEGLTLPIF